MRRILILCLLLVVVVAPVSAQAGNTVYILVVDDFGDQMSAISSALLANPVIRGQFDQDVQHLPRAGTGQTVTRPGGGVTRQGAGTPSSSSQSVASTPTPAPQGTPTGLELSAQFAAQAQQAVTTAVQGDVTTQNCSVVPEGQGFFATSGTSFFATSGTGFFATSGTGQALTNQPHGIRVMNELRQLVTRYGAGLNIQLVQVDTAGFTTSVITQRLTAQLSQLAAAHPTASFVINMSFAVIPCSALATLAIYDAFMHEVDSKLAGDLTALQQVFQTLLATGVFAQPPNGSDNLQSFLVQSCDSVGNCRTGTNRVIAVAAAGNSSTPFPFFPAAWGGVISVSASGDNTDFIARSPRASYSNAGAILMPGKWQNELGTSFAAPRYSFAMALYLLGQRPVGCPANLTPGLPDDWMTAPPAHPDQPIC